MVKQAATDEPVPVAQSCELAAFAVDQPTREQIVMRLAAAQIEVEESGELAND